ncbi:MAG: hypothetical protein LBO08_02675 [Rickettsiales bacterium]|jgi:hypothetical protein|nr:hypothetical protein [Rickettsiales bacterium]
MKKIVYFLIGFCITGLAVYSIYLGAVFFDASRNIRVRPDIFQPNNLSSQRIGKPIPIEDLSDNYIMTRLVKKYMHEYFFVMPSSENLTARSANTGILARLSDRAVMDKWTATQLPVMQKLAADKKYRIVNVIEPIIPQEDYLEVNFQLQTFDPYALGGAPLIENGTVHIRIKYANGIQEVADGFDAKKYLGGGGDPAGIFKFRVMEMK